MAVITYELVANVEEVGTAHSNGHSRVGHAWYSIRRLEDGIVIDTIDAGYHVDGIRNNDSVNYHGDSFHTTVPIEISAEAFNSLEDLATQNSSFANSLGFSRSDYNLLRNNCVNFVYTAFQTAGVIPDNFNASNFMTGLPQDRALELDHVVSAYNGMSHARVSRSDWLVDDNGQLYFVGTVSHGGEGSTLSRMELAQMLDQLREDMDGNLVGLDSGYSGINIGIETGMEPGLRPPTEEELARIRVLLNPPTDGTVDPEDDDPRDENDPYTNQQPPGPHQGEVDPYDSDPRDESNPYDGYATPNPDDYAPEEDAASPEVHQGQVDTENTDPRGESNLYSGSTTPPQQPTPSQQNEPNPDINDPRGESYMYSGSNGSSQSTSNSSSTSSSGSSGSSGSSNSSSSTTYDPRGESNLYGGYSTTSVSSSSSESSSSSDSSDSSSDSSSSGSSWWSWFFPIAMDLDGDGVELTDINSSTAFYDIQGDGYQYRMGWVDTDDGLLAFDINNDGVINQDGEISFVDYIETATTDLEGLVYFDSNDDGLLNIADNQWSQFGV